MNLVDQPVASFRGPWWEGYCLAVTGPDVYFRKWLRDAVVRYRPKISAVAWKNFKNGVRAGLRDYVRNTAQQFAIDAPAPVPVDGAKVITVRPRGERISPMNGASPGVLPFMLPAYQRKTLADHAANARAWPRESIPELTEFIALRKGIGAAP